MGQRTVETARDTHPEVQDDSTLEWDLVITLAVTMGMRKGELLSPVWSDIDFAEMVVEVNPKLSSSRTWEWRIKDSDRRMLPLTEDVCRLLIVLQGSRPEGYLCVCASMPI